MRILHLESDKYVLQDLQRLKEIGELVCKDFKKQSELDSLLKKEKFDYIFTTIGYYFGAENLESQSKLKAIVSPTTGLNHIDLDYVKGRNIKIISLKGEYNFLSSIQSTAEHTWTLLLSLSRQLQKAVSHTKDGSWDRTVFECNELNTKTIGIIGYGRLGKIITRYASAFSMNILVNDIDKQREEEAKEKGLNAVDLSKLLEESDFVLLMVSHSHENENMIGEKEFDKMKQGSFFINTSRGEMVDEDALLKNLESGHLAGSALDVLRNDSEWKNEVPENHPLIQYANRNNNLIITPHIGGYGDVSIAKTREFITNKFFKSIDCC
ncbi:MAG: hypothetical protein J5I91_01725 [Bacteroidetes bacterium]|nr:hypothetical protein [Bacteroidota bacterium]